MKAIDLLNLVENSKNSDGGLGKQTYQNDHTPDNHVKGKKTKEVHQFDKGEKHDGKKVTQVAGPKSKEKRKMEGPGSKAKKLHEQAQAAKIKQTIRGIGQDPTTGRNSITIYDVKKKGDITVPFVNDKEFEATVQALNSGNDFQATQAYRALITSDLARPGKAEGERGGTYKVAMGEADAGAVQQAIRKIDAATNSITVYNPAVQADVTLTLDTPANFKKIAQALKSGNDRLAGVAYSALIKHPKAVTGRGKTGGQDMYSKGKSGFSGQAYGRNVGRSMSQDEFDQAGSMFSLADSKGNRPTMESGGEHADAMGKQTTGKTKFVSKKASVRTKQNDAPKPTAKVDTPKKKEKRSMDENPVSVKDYKGGENEHKKMGVYEGVDGLEKWLGRKIDLQLDK